MYSADLKVSGGDLEAVAKVVLDVKHGANLARDDVVQLAEPRRRTRRSTSEIARQKARFGSRST